MWRQDASERVMLKGRSYHAMRAAFEHVSQRVPFAIKELHPDHGHLVRFWHEKVSGVHLSRSRPYHKNDNRNVEQKNNTQVAAVFGALRLETAGYIAAGNQVYEQMWLYYTHRYYQHNPCHKNCFHDRNTYSSRTERRCEGKSISTTYHHAGADC